MPKGRRGETERASSPSGLNSLRNLVREGRSGSIEVAILSASGIRHGQKTSLTYFEERLGEVWR